MTTLYCCFIILWRWTCIMCVCHMLCGSSI